MQIFKIVLFYRNTLKMKNYHHKINVRLVQYDTFLELFYIYNYLRIY